MRPAVVVEADPVTVHAAGVLQGLETMSVRALLLQRADHALHQAILLGRVRRDELLLEAVAARQRGIASAGEDQAVVAA